MGSKSGNGWWKQLFQGNDGARRKKRNAELGSDDIQSLSGQTDPLVEFIRQEVYDSQTGVTISVELICTCGLPVAHLYGEGNFYCLHCDRHCEIGLMRCPQCAYGMMDRDEFIETYDEDED